MNEIDLTFFPRPAWGTDVIVAAYWVCLSVSTVQQGDMEFCSTEVGELSWSRPHCSARTHTHTTLNCNLNTLSDSHS